MRFKFTVEIEVNRTTGKFPSRDDVAQELQDALDNANPGDLQVGDDSELEVSDWSVEEQPQEKPKRVRKSTPVKPQRMVTNPNDGHAPIIVKGSAHDPDRS